jgi:hypothetical protein
VYDPQEREAMTEVLADRFFDAKVIRVGIGEVERWTSVGGGVMVEFPVHGDATARVYHGRADGEPGELIGIARDHAGLEFVLPPTPDPDDLGCC